MQSNIKVKKTPIDAKVMETSKTIQIKPKPIQSAPKAGNTTIEVDGVEISEQYCSEICESY